MKLTNSQIYNQASLLATALTDFTQRLPIKVNFYFHKNKYILINMAKDIERMRSEILQSASVLNEETGQYTILEEKKNEVTEELNALFDITQDVDIRMVKLDDFGNFSLTLQQMEALMFMIEE